MPSLADSRLGEPGAPCELQPRQASRAQPWRISPSRMRRGFHTCVQHGGGPGRRQSLSQCSALRPAGLWYSSGTRPLRVAASTAPCLLLGVGLAAGGACESAAASALAPPQLQPARALLRPWSAWPPAPPPRASPQPQSPPPVPAAKPGGHARPWPPTPARRPGSALLPPSFSSWPRQAMCTGCPQRCGHAWPVRAAMQHPGRGPLQPD
jgi:hypothetical protein